MERLAGKRDGKIERNGMGIGLLITFVVGACFGYIMCAVLSANTTDEEWRDLLDEVADRHHTIATDSPTADNPEEYRNDHRNKRGGSKS